MNWEARKVAVILEALTELEGKVSHRGYVYVSNNHETIEKDAVALRPVGALTKYHNMYDKGRITWDEYLAVRNYIVVLVRTI